MQNLPAPAAALFRFLYEQRLDYSVGRPATAARIELIVPQAARIRVPSLLRAFGRAHELELIERREAPDGADLYRLSCTSKEQRPQFLTVAVRTQGAQPFREHLVRLRGWLRPRGLLIACLGPPGSGKSSVIQALNDRPLDVFESVHTMELRPGVMRAGTIKATSRTRKREPRGGFTTIIKLMMFVVDYWLGYWLWIRPKLVRATLVVSNRYFDDVLADPRRYRIDRALTFARLLLRWVPRPQLWLVFDIPSQALQGRQEELGEEEATRLRAEYRRLLRDHENVVVLDADQPLERVVAQAECAIASELARRTTRRLGLPPETTSNPTATKILLFFSRREIPLVSRFVRVLFNSDIQSRLPPDIHLPHPYGIIVHPQAVIGRRVTLMQQVTIGGRDHRENIAPLIGDDVYVGAGARVLGDVRIGQGVVIGANAVVTRDIPPGVTVVGANRIVATPKPAGGADASITPFPVGVQRGPRAGRGT